ncbi:MAG: glycosyltransferase [Blastocatellia bacterium]
MLIVFYILAALLIFLSYKSFLGGFDYLNYFKREVAKPISDYLPFATVIAPCKGLDEGLEKNVAVLIEQNYPAYEVIFVVDDESDDALSVIKGLMDRTDVEPQRKETSASPCFDGQNIKLVVAPQAIDASQKVENLREAVLHANDRSRVFVFVDSDVRPARDWLRYLIAPLADSKIGAATGYRWFISQKQTFASEMRAVWNASIASALGANTRSNFCWGGSMAIRRDTFEKLDMREKWRGTLSDDFAVTRAMNEANLPIYFVPQSLTASIENCTFRELFEFTTRQMKITRTYAPHLWKLSFFGSGLFTVVMLSAFLIVILSRQNSWSVAVAIATLVLVAVFSIGKAWLRLKAVRLVLKEYDSALRDQTFSQITLWLLSPPLFLYNSFCAWLSRRTTWRGTTYELVSANETRRID